MKVLTFSADYNRFELDKMSESALYDLAAKNPYDCNIYGSLTGFQEAFNDDDVSDTGWLYFVNL